MIEILTFGTKEMPKVRLSMKRGVHFRSAERGASLIISLIFLVILTILGITALRVATLEERMSGNARDRSIAFQAAEAALRDAELDIRCQNYEGNAATTSYMRSIGCISGMTGADADCANGLCCNPSGLACIEPTTPVYKNASISFTASPSVELGTYTKKSATDKPVLTGLSQQPRYLIEPFVKDSVNYYRITARGFGLNSSTQVTLEEVYKE